MLEEPLTELTRSPFRSATEAVWAIERELTRQKALAHHQQSTRTRVIK